MESLEDSNCQSMSDSFSLYERYMKSFANCGEENPEASDSSSHSDSESSNSRGNIELSTAQSHLLNKHSELGETECNIVNAVYCNILDKEPNFDSDVKVESLNSPAASLLDNSSATIDYSLLTDKSNQTDVQVSSEENKHESINQPIFISSTMENSNNAVDSVPMFRDIRRTESVFKLPISELSFNGTIKHVKKLQPIVDPISALSSNKLDHLDESVESYNPEVGCNENAHHSHCHQLQEGDQKSCDLKSSDSSDNMSRLEKTSDSTSDTQYGEKKDTHVIDDGSTTKWNLDHSHHQHTLYKYDCIKEVSDSHSSFDASFDSGVRSPDMFSDNENEDQGPEIEPFWSFLKDHEAYDKRKVKKIEEALHGILPPPSVTTLKTDVTEMLKKYYTHLPLFNEVSKEIIPEETNSTTPTKKVAFIDIPEYTQDAPDKHSESISRIDTKCSYSKDKLNNSEHNSSHNSDKTIDLKTCTEVEAVETAWPDLLKCRHYDVYYNVTKYSEKFELLSLKYGERYVGAETVTSVNIHSGGFESPSSASKRKAMRLKLAQVKSPGRRLSHLARRRQAFCSAATINEKAHASTAKMVLIDKNYFPHRKLINSADRKSPRIRRTPGKNTPTRKTPGKKTPAKTPKTRSGGSSKKKAMRRLLMDPDSMTRSQPREIKRALFVSPERKKTVPAPCTSVPLHAMRTKRALFGSPDRLAETKSSDGTQSDQFLKRKLDMLDDQPENSRSKIAKSLSFGGDMIGSSQSISFSRRASELFPAKKTVDLNGIHKQKLLWAVSEALRLHGWRMSSPGFREKASNLARLTRRLLALPPHAARLAAHHLSTSDTLLKVARLYVFAIIQGRSVEECFQEEQTRLSNDATSKVSGYISANTYQQIKARQMTTAPWTSQIKENTFTNMSPKPDQPKSGAKNVLQDKLVNIDTNSNSSSGLGALDKSALGIFKSNSMPSFEDAAKMRARRQISFDNLDFPKR